MKNEIVAYLLEMGVKPHYKGFDYLVQALMITASAPGHISIGEVYTRVAEVFEITKPQVERCIRTVISTYCESPESGMRRAYTNAEFIFLCTRQLKIRPGFIKK